MKKNWLIVAMISLMLILAACGDKNEAANSKETGELSTGVNEHNFKISHVVQETHVWHKTAEKFKEELEALSNGKMTATIYSAASLGLEADMVQQLETGTLDFGFLTNAYMSTREEALNGWFMPFVFEDLSEAVKMRESEEAKEMLNELKSQGLVGLDFAFAGNRHILSKDGFIESQEDLKGKKMRIIGSPAMQSFWEATGAGPTAMPLPEVYTSLQTGVIDGMDIDLDALMTEKYYENANYLTLTNHMTFPTVVVMSSKIFDGLSEEEQKIVQKAVKNAVDWGADEAVAREATNLEELKKLGVEVATFDSPETFEKATTSVREQYSEKSDIIKRFIEKSLNN